MFIQVAQEGLDNFYLNLTTLKTYKAQEKEDSEGNTIYEILYILENNTNLTEAFDNQSDRDAKIEELDNASTGGGGGSATLINKNINANGTYNASNDNADGYKKVVVNVPSGSSYAPLHITFGGYDGTNQQLAQDMANLDISNITSMQNMFNGMTGPTSVNTGSWDTSNITNMAYMFSDSGLSSITFGSSFNTSNVTNMMGMFNLMHVSSLDLSGFDTSNVTDMSGMFGYNDAIQTLDLSMFDTSNVENYSGMFAECIGLTGLLDLSSFTVGNDVSEIYVSEMLPDESMTPNLTGVDLSNFDFTKASSEDIQYLCGYNYSNINYVIYVKDQTQKDYLEQNNHYLKNVQIKGGN